MLKTNYFLVVFALASGCAGQVRDKSTGTNWLACTKDVDCFALRDARCGPKNVCVDASGEPIDKTTVPGKDGGASDSSGSGAEAGASSGGGGGNSGGAGGSAFAGCTIPPQSECTHDETCKGLDCGGPQYDADGCQRAPCTTDGDCALDERCTLLACRDTYQCFYEGNVCQCGGPAVCDAASYCNAVSTVGPRGAWTTIEVDDNWSLCDDNDDGCVNVWLATSDGTLSRKSTRSDHSTSVGADAGASTVVLDESDQQALGALIDGPELRSALQDGIPCMNDEVLDYSATMTLVLSGQTLKAEVAGCVDGNSSNVVNQVYQLLTRSPR